MRTMTPAVDAALAADNLPLLLLIDLDFPSGAVSASNAGLALAWNSKTWTQGLVGKIAAIREGSDLQASGVAFELSGVSVPILTAALNDAIQGRAARVWVAPLASDYTAIIDPVLVYEGRMDTASITFGDTATVSLTTENRLIDLDRARIRRFNSEDQSVLYPDDRGFDFLPSLVEKQIVWGRA